MKLLLIAALLLNLSPPVKNTAVPHIDPKRYAGTWYSLFSIPTRWDKGSRETTGRYTWNEKGYFEVQTSCLNDKAAPRSVNSKVFISDQGDGEMKAQFLWPFKVDYRVIELADDYSYVVVGHPDFKMLFIMARKKTLSPSLYKAIVDRCKAKGYDVSKLTSQKHAGS